MATTSGQYRCSKYHCSNPQIGTFFPKEGAPSPEEDTSVAQSQASRSHARECGPVGYCGFRERLVCADYSRMGNRRSNGSKKSLPPPHLQRLYESSKPRLSADGTFMPCASSHAHGDSAQKLCASSCRTLLALGHVFEKKGGPKTD